MFFECEIDLRILFQQAKANDEKMDGGKISFWRLLTEADSDSSRGL